MSRPQTWKVMFGIAAILTWGGVALAQHEGHDHAGHDHDHDHAAHGGGEAMDQQAMMEMMQKLAAPGEHHEHLAKLAGKWNVAVKMWMAPGAPPTESTGTAKNEMILGGRFLQSNFDGSFMGESFVGLGLDGYDNAAKEHIGLWIDTAGTMMMKFKGNCSEDGRVQTMTSTFKEPMSGMDMTMKGVITLVSDKEYTYESWMKTPMGEFKSMEITYTRR